MREKQQRNRKEEKIGKYSIAQTMAKQQPRAHRAKATLLLTITM